MRVLVCGDRNWDDDEMIDLVLSGAAFENSGDLDFVVINGLAKGADARANEWAKTWQNDEPSGFPDRVFPDPYPADWEKHHRAAGPIRNQQMLVEGKPEVVFAFHDNIASSKGTRDMVNRAVKADIPTYVISRVHEKVVEVPLPDKKEIRKGLKQIALDVEGL